MRVLSRHIAAALVVAGFGILTASSVSYAAPETTVMASGLKMIDTKEGTGPSPKIGQNVSVHYTGWLYNNGEQGAKFDSSRDRNDPFEFALGAGMVIKAGTKAYRA